MATIRGLGAVRVGDAIGEPPPGEEATRALPAPDARGRRLRRGDPSSRARSGRPSPSSPSRIRSSTSARTSTATRSRSRSTARSRRRSSRRRSSATTASPPTSARRRPCASSARRASARPRRSSAAKTKTNITGRSSPLSTNPFMATLAPADRAGAVGLRDRVPHRRRGPARPALPVQDGRGVRDPDGGVRPRGADRGPGRLAGDRLPGHDDRLRLRVTGHVRGRLPAADAARADDRARARRHVGLRAARRPHARDAGVDRAGRAGRARPARRARDRPVLGERPVARSAPCCRSPASAASSTSCPACRWGRGSSRRAPAATSRSASDPPTRPRSSPSPLDRDAWLASLAKRG